MILEDEVFVRAKLINTVPSNELILRYKFVYRMVFEERKTRSSLVTGWGVAIGRDQEKHGLTFWRRIFFYFSTLCILNVNNTGTKYVRIVKQTAF